MSEPYNAGNRKSINAAAKAARVLEQQHREAVVSIMATRAGRSWMCTKLEDAHIFHEDFTGNALREAFQKGQRNFGLLLLADIHRFCPEDYLTMMKERNERNSRGVDNADGSTTPEHDGSPDPDGGVEGRVTANDYDIYGTAEASGT